MIMTEAIPERGMRIDRSMRLAPGEYDFTDGDGIVIAADDIVIDGCGAWLRGGCKPQAGGSASRREEFGYGAAAQPDNARELGYCGVGLRAQGRRRVVIMNLRLSGFDIGALMESCEGVSLINCDLSGCFHDPAWGWDEHGEHGAIVMRSCRRSEIVSCRAREVWDALNLRDCEECNVYGCDFSHTSDTGLKLWHSSRCHIANCDFSYGIRIDPGEVHARDSSSVLIESGSDDNWFFGNDMSHGGDGLFIRVLNGWMSCGNVFIENDCSYANNNAIEAWSDRNTYIRNKANYSSYGFWLGNSDYTVLEGNEAAFNGDPAWHSNAPESFGNAGIAIVNGSGSHSVLRGNDIHDNCGPGIAIRNSLDNPSRHWVIEGNCIERNRDQGRYRGHGIYLRHARLIALGGNEFADNAGEDVLRDGNVADVTLLPGEGGAAQGELSICARYGTWPRAGESVEFECRGARGVCEWEFGDERTAVGARTEHVFDAPGLYPVSVTARDGAHAALAGMTLTVLPSDFEPLTIAGARSDAAVSREAGLYGAEAVCARAHGGSRHTLELDVAGQACAQAGAALVMQVQHFSDAPTDWDKQTRYPRITLTGAQGGETALVPLGPWLEMLHAPRNEMRGEGRLFVIPLRGDAMFEAQGAGLGCGEAITGVSIEYGGMGEGISELRINALGLAAAPAADESWPDAAAEAQPVCEGEILRGDAREVVGARGALRGDATARVTLAGAGALSCVFPLARVIDRVECVFYQNLTGSDGAHGERLPSGCALEALIAGEWRAVDCGAPRLRFNAATVFAFAPLECEGVRVRFEGGASIARLSARHTRALPVRVSAAPRREAVDALWVKLNKELNGNGSPLGELTARVFSLDGEGKLADCLFEARVPADAIRPYEPLRIATPGLTLTEGERCALALGQTERARSHTEGDYYRWIGGHIDCDETFAIYDGGRTLPSDYDWGTAWLRVEAGEAATDLTHDSDHVGTRFGIEGMECRYQTFSAPSQCGLIADGRVAGAGYELRGEVELEIAAPCAALDIYAPERSAAALEVVDAQGRVLARAQGLERGRNRLELSCACAGTLTLRAGEPVRMTEVEVMGL